MLTINVLQRLPGAIESVVVANLKETGHYQCPGITALPEGNRLTWKFSAPLANATVALRVQVEGAGHNAKAGVNFQRTRSDVCDAAKPEGGKIW